MDSIDQRITDFKFASAAWKKAADDYQAAKQLDDMWRCRLMAARHSEVVAILRDQKASYWRATVATNRPTPQP
jgi:hypothetical protein